MNVKDENHQTWSEYRGRVCANRVERKQEMYRYKA